MSSGIHWIIIFLYFSEADPCLLHICHLSTKFNLYLESFPSLTRADVMYFCFYTFHNSLSGTAPSTHHTCVHCGHCTSPFCTRNSPAWYTEWKSDGSPVIVSVSSKLSAACARVCRFRTEALLKVRLQCEHNHSFPGLKCKGNMGCQVLTVVTLILSHPIFHSHPHTLHIQSWSTVMY